MNKPSPLSFFKNLPPDRRDMVYAYMRANTYRKTREMIFRDLPDDVAAWEKENGKRLMIADGIMSEFWHWYPLSRQLEDAMNLGDSVKTILKDMPDLSLSSDQIARAGQMAFEAQAIRTQDAKLFIGLRKQRVTEQALNLDRDKFEFSATDAALEALDDLRAIRADNTLDSAGRRQAARQRLFGSAPA